MTVNRNYDFGEEYDLEGEASPSSDIHDVDAAIFGEVRGKGAQIVGRPLSITHVWPDMKQPRRAVPLAARGQWTGNPNDVPAVLAAWHELAEREINGTLDLLSLVRSSGEGLEVNPEQWPVVAEYLELVALAASIHNRGLTNPITVTKQGKRYIIETGERRWLAFHLLTLWAEGDWIKIPSVVKERADVWRQAEENAARRPLNAVGIARQLALLIMDMYHDEDFGQFDQVVLPGECDRKFYAQVANGQTWPVKRGLGQAVLNATGLKSKNQISQYRNLLDIPDAMWVTADLENWTEFKIRSALQELNAPPEMDDRLTTVNLQPGENGGNQGESAELDAIEFQPFRPVGSGNLVVDRPTPPMAGGETGTDEAGLVPTQGDDANYPPTPPSLWGGYEEAGASSPGFTSDPAERQPVVVAHPQAGQFLQMIGQFNEATEGDPQVAATVASLLQLSPESIRWTVTKYGGLETYRTELERMTEVLWNFLNPRMDELVDLIETLQAIGAGARMDAEEDHE